MSKKHKKIFKQKIKQLLSEMEREPAQPAPIPIKPEENLPVQSPEPQPLVSKTVTPPQPETSVPTLVPISIVKAELKKIALIFLILILVVIAAFFISSKTNWLFILADKFYGWAELGG